MKLLLDKYGNEYRHETPNLFSVHSVESWSKAILKEAQKRPFFEKFIGPLLVDQYGNRLGSIDVLPSNIQVNK